MVHNKEKRLWSSRGQSETERWKTQVQGRESSQAAGLSYRVLCGWGSPCDIPRAWANESAMEGLSTAMMGHPKSPAEGSDLGVSVPRKAP